MPILRAPTRKGREIDQERKVTERPERFPANRRCPDCAHLLSRYNPGPSCWAHQSAHYTFVDSVQDLRELMEAA